MNEDDHTWLFGLCIYLKFGKTFLRNISIEIRKVIPLISCQSLHPEISVLFVTTAHESKIISKFKIEIENQIMGYICPLDPGLPTLGL